MATNMNKPTIAGMKYVSERVCGCVVAVGAGAAAESSTAR
jgi:hypothetical protein